MVIPIYSNPLINFHDHLVNKALLKVEISRTPMPPESFALHTAFYLIKLSPFFLFAWNPLHRKFAHMLSIFLTTHLGNLQKAIQ